MSNVLVSSWGGVPIRISCRLVPRFAYMTATIDVYLDEKLKLQTGGVFKFVGNQSAEFEHLGRKHELALSWGKAGLRRFPIELTIDGAVVESRTVPIQNWYLVFLPAVALAVALALLNRR